MSNSVLLNHGSQTIGASLGKLIAKASSLDLAVSYLQAGGWTLLAKMLPDAKRPRTRILFTDQMDITHPTAVQNARDAGVPIRRFSGSQVYHPKVYLLRNDKGRSFAAVVGSANLSDSALSTGVEAASIVTSRKALNVLDSWFVELWATGQPVTAPMLDAYRDRWKLAASARVALRRSRRQHLPKMPASDRVEEIEVLNDVFETVQTPIASLGSDQAGNNIRNFRHMLEVLHHANRLSDKQRSELRLLGFYGDDGLTELGTAARKCRSEAQLALVWCRWLKVQPSEELSLINPKLRLNSLREAARRFWALQPAVRTYFFKNLTDKKARPVLQAIELLCNAGAVATAFELEDFVAASVVLRREAGLPQHLRWHVAEYRRNKGARSWTNLDRRLLLEAWRKAS